MLFWLTLILTFHSNVILIDRGSRLLHPGRQEPRGPHRRGEDCSARQTLPWKQHKASDQNQGIKGIQGAVLNLRLAVFSILPSDLFRAQLTSWWPRPTTVWWLEAPPGWNSSPLLSRFRPVSEAWRGDRIIIWYDMICNFRQQFLLHLFFFFEHQVPLHGEWSLFLLFCNYFTF